MDSVAPWKVRAVGSTIGMVADADEVRRALELFADPDNACELMALTAGIHRTVAGNDVSGLSRAVNELPGGIGIYFRVNPVPVGLPRPARDRDVIKRRWLYVDVDPVKPDEFKDKSATDTEKALAGSVCDAVNAHMIEAGWPAPVIVDSGNGYGMFWKCDLPNDEMTKATTKRWLGDLAKRFSGESGKIDTAVHNANRLVKLPGTWARKGSPSDDRPHRPCKIIHVPSEILPVSFEQLTRVCEVDQPRPKPSSYTPPSNGKGSGAYGRKALDCECSRVVFATERNNALNRAAFSLGQLIAGKVLDEAEVIERLRDAARQSGLDRDPGCGERGINATIASGLNAGKESPRAPQGQPKIVWSKTQFIEAVKADEKKLSVKLSSVQPLKVDWLVPGRIPKRFITVFAGRTGVGKSFVASDLIARMSVGGEIPCSGGLCFEQGGALIISEDSHEYVLAPRLIGLGADLSRINAMTWEAMGHYQLGDTEMLDRAVKEVEGGASIVLIDPPTNFLGDVDEHKNSEVRQLVMKVVEWCFSRDLACLFVLHVNKQTGKGIEAINRVMGSVAWVSTSRIAHSFCLDPEDRTRGLWMPTKSNLGPIPKGLAYRITGDEAKVEWLGEVDMTADEAMSASPQLKKRGVVASEWLIERFREKKEWASDDLFAAARAENVSRSSIFEAKELLQLPRAKKNTLENGDIRWVWWVPESWPPFHRGTEPVEPVEPVEGKS